MQTTWLNDVDLVCAAQRNKGYSTNILNLLGPVGGGFVKMLSYYSVDTILQNTLTEQLDSKFLLKSLMFSQHFWATRYCHFTAGVEGSPPWYKLTFYFFWMLKIEFLRHSQELMLLFTPSEMKLEMQLPQLFSECSRDILLMINGKDVIAPVV